MLKEKVINVGKTAYFNFTEYFLTKIEEHQVEQLLNKTRSSRKNTSIIAKAKLKKFFPEVWEIVKFEVK